jgi:GT2 family glycosyltransferase
MVFHCASRVPRRAAALVAPWRRPAAGDPGGGGDRIGMSSQSTDGLPALAVVVLSYGPRRTILAAVQSLLRQDTPAEVVVVHSGAGDVGSCLAAAAADVRVIQSRDRLLPGAARNLGIAQTRAPFVAFLADDCVAERDWVRQRLSAHAQGAPAVASALVSHRPSNPVALAAHLSLYVRRMPRADPAVALRYGVSYARSLFDKYGLFRTDLESGEDTDFNQRLHGADAPVWAPGVLTVHHGADTLAGFFNSQWRRGRRMARAWRAIGALDATAVAKDALARTSLIIREAWSVVEPRRRLAMLLCVPLIVLGNMVYAWGAWWSRGRS